VYLPAGKLDGQALRIPMPAVAQVHGFAFQQGQVRALRLDERRAALASGQEIEYTRVVIAAGAPADRGRIPGSAEHALFPCEQDDASRLADTVAAGLRGPLTIVVTGERIGPPLEFAG